MTNHPSNQPSSAKDPSMFERAQAGTTPPAQRGLLTAWRRLTRGRAALTVLAATVALCAAASPASAAGWGYEQISPGGGSAIDVLGLRVSKDLSTVQAATNGAPLAGMPSDGRVRMYYYGLPRGGAPWTVGPVNVINGPHQNKHYVGPMSPDGSHMLLESELPSVDGALGGAYRVDAQGGAVNVAPGMSYGVIVANADVDAMALLSTDFPGGVFIGRPGQAPVQASVDNAGTPMSATGVGGAYNSSIVGPNVMFAGNAFAPDGSSVIFTSADGVAGDNDIAHAFPWDPVGFKDVYRRVLTPGHEETYAISDANGSGDDDAGLDAAYRWATADQSRVFFVTAEALESGDTDGEQDVYLRDGKNAPVRISQGETVDGAPTGNGSNPPLSGQADTEWVMSSQDGNRTFFVTSERLTQDAPADGIKLYERDVAEGRTRLVAGPLSIQDVTGGSIVSPEDGPLVTTSAGSLPELSFRGLRVTPDGAVFQSRAPLAGSVGDGTKVFAWTRGGGLEQIGKPGGATILPVPLPVTVADQEMRAWPGRAVSDDGSHVLFSTSQSLTAQDADGGFSDLYEWSKVDGVRLVTPPGRAPYSASYIDSSPDGSQVFFTTAESILPSDTDPNAIDIYVARLGGGAPPGPPVPDADPHVCGGAACQGPVAGLTPPSIGSVSFAGPGNVPAGTRAVTPSVDVSNVKAVIGSAATLKVRVPDGGKISVTGASLRPASVSAAKAGTYSVKVALTARAKTTLKKKKSVKVSVQVTYRPSDDQSASTTVSVTFKQPKAKPAKTKKGGR
jgi:hypothetical protein